VLVSQEEFVGMDKMVLRILWEDLEDGEESPPHPRICYTGRRNGMLAWVIEWREVSSREEFSATNFQGFRRSQRFEMNFSPGVVYILKSILHQGHKQLGAPSDILSRVSVIHFSLYQA